MVETKSQREKFFQYRKQIYDLVHGIQSNLLRVARFIAFMAWYSEQPLKVDQENKEAKKYVNVVNLTKEEYQKAFTEYRKQKNEREKLKAEKNKAAETNKRINDRYLQAIKSQHTKVKHPNNGEECCS